MKQIKILTILFLAGLVAGCSDNVNEPIHKDGTPPGALTNLSWEPLAGGATITYDLPGDKDLLYATAEYTTKKGEKRDFKASLYNNYITILGLGDTDVYTVSLYAVDRSENRSEPVTVDITPGEPPVVVSYNSLNVVEDWGGIKVSFTNPTGADLVFEVYAPGESGGMEPLPAYYTNETEGSFNLRGLESVETNFDIFVRDKYGNRSETLRKTLTPVFETELDKTKFNKMELEGDSPCNEYDSAMEYIWDGRIVSDDNNSDNPKRVGMHTGSGGSSQPKFFTFDLGVEAKLSRFTLWQIQDDRHSFNDKSPRFYEVWGRADMPTDGSWDGWTLLLEMESIKPSGLPLGSLTVYDRNAILAGDQADFSNELGKMRYIRIKCLKSWTGDYNMCFTELSFWGDDGSNATAGK